MTPRAAVVALALLLSSSVLFARQQPTRQDTTTAAPAETAQVQQPPAILESAGQDSMLQAKTGTSSADSAGTQSKADGFNVINWLFGLIASVLVALFAFVLTRLPQPLFSKDERRFRKLLQNQLGKIKLVGPGMDNIAVRLDDTFVQLRISGDYRVAEHPTWASEKRAGTDADGYTPDELLQITFNQRQERDLLLIIGDPGSGKTTLMQYYAIKALSNKGRKNLGFKKPVLPIYLPLREVDASISVAENLAAWCKKHSLSISKERFEKWVHNKHTLVLFDGLDEVRDADDRRKICQWIDETCSGLDNAYLVVTSRPTGIRGRDRVVLSSDLLQADIRDFTPRQREEFLRKWFRAAFLKEIPSDGVPRREWQREQRALANAKTQSLLEFFAQDKNKSLAELSGIPMLLQIMAILWKKDEHLPNNRAKLYQIALDYLLEYQGAQRNLVPPLSAEQAQRVLSPVCLWIQEKWQREEVPKKKMQDMMQQTLRHIPDAPAAASFCDDHLRDRAGIIADNSKEEYIFRHKSFREFYAGLELAQRYHQGGRLQKLAAGFHDEWWEETLRFFISRATGDAFDGFMKALFNKAESRELDSIRLNRLLMLVEEAPEPRIDALLAHLNNPKATEEQRRYILDCMKTIGTAQAKNAMLIYVLGAKFKEFKSKADQFFGHQLDPESARVYVKPLIEFISSDKVLADSSSKAHAKQLLLETFGAEGLEVSDRPQDIFQSRPKAFHNAIEYNAEYILIPGGVFHYSVTKREEQVPDVYFAKYPVTNKRYRRFIRYLRGDEAELREQLPLDRFGVNVLAFAAKIPDYQRHLGSDVNAWAEKLQSPYDDDRKLNGDDQPVVGVSWYAARTYGLWLSLFENAQAATAIATATVYRLPTEIEWERAAVGLPGEKEAPRAYPWGNAEPNDQRANFGGNVGATTPVGRYPAGATPEGLLDMAGNVWEWQENWSDESTKETRALRGGSWNLSSNYLRATLRNWNDPVLRNFSLGFRLLRAQSSL